MSNEEVWPPATWGTHTYPHGDHEHRFYVVGDALPRRPSILLLHEFPGIKPTIIRVAEQLGATFRVVMPSIFGRDGDPRLWDSLRQICVRKEIHAFAHDGASASVGWLKGFVDAHVSSDKASYGVVGMCFSGNFALALAVDERVKAAVVAQPALPLWPPSALGLSADDRRALASRGDLCVRGYRYERDCKSPDSKLRSAEELFGGNRMRVLRLPTDKPRHSTLTDDVSDTALADLQEFLEEALLPPHPDTPSTSPPD